MQKRLISLLVACGLSFAAALGLSSCAGKGIEREPWVLPPDPFLRRGQELFLAGDFQSAAASFSEAVVTSKSSLVRAEALYWRGLSYYRLGNYVQARQDLEWCLREPPEGSLEAAAQAALGHVLMALGDTHSARQHYQEALARGGDRIDLAEVTYSIGLSHQREGDWAQAAPYYRRAADDYASSRFAKYAQEKLGHVGEKFYVQIGAFSDPAKAESLGRDATGKGLNASVRRLARGDRELHCVWVGPFETWDEAVRKAEALKAFSYETYVVP